MGSLVLLYSCYEVVRMMQTGSLAIQAGIIPGEADVNS